MDRPIDAIVRDTAKRNAAPRARSAKLRDDPILAAANCALVAGFGLLMLLVAERYFELGV